MPGFITLDFETSVGYDTIDGKRVEGTQGPTFRNPNNDIHTIIYGDSPDRIKLLHSKKGFKRKLPYRVGKMLVNSHTLITQNGKFDMAYIWNDKYFQQFLEQRGKVWDIGYCRYLLSYQRHSFPSLAEMQALYLGEKTKPSGISKLFKRFIGADEIIARRKERKNWWKLYEYYCHSDGKTPMQIMQKQHKEAKAKGMLPIIELFNAYLLSLTMIEQNGIDVDEAQLQENERIIALEQVEHLANATKLVGNLWSDPRLPSLNINSNDHKSLILFGGKITCKVKKDLDIVIKSGPNKGKFKTKLFDELVTVKGFGLDKNLTAEGAKEGFYQTNEAVILNIYKKCTNEQAKEFCKYMRMAATSKKMLTTYIKGIKDRTVNGKLYPNLNNTETITTRLSSSKINMQNIPASGRYNKLIQGLFVAPKGWTCVSIDFSQLEVYIQAMLAKDASLIADIRSGKDLHCQNVAWASKSMGWTKEDITYQQAVQWCKKEKIPEWEQRRSEAKPITFGKAYGKMEEAASRDTGIPLPVMKEIYKAIDEQYPDVAKFDEAVALEVYENTQISKKSDLAAKYTKGTKQGEEQARRFEGEVELLPIKWGKGSKVYKFRDFNGNTHPRHVGVYISPTGKRYCFEERATLTKNNDVYKYFLSTEMKNYAVQGGASDAQACTTVEMFQFLLRNPDKVKMLNEIHDSKWFIVKDEYLSCIVPKLCAIMSKAGKILNRRFNLDTDLIFGNEAKLGRDFANMVGYEEYINVNNITS